ncbi:ribonuclease J [Candidatus Magnetoovum chiemensis]|nr:ribonuclease J [Candidatus Magnetoovum chiemensis]
MTVILCSDDMIVIDAGLMFPDDDMHGIEYVIPDYSYIIENKDKLRAIIITHGHEDHTGALPHLLRDLAFPVPILSTHITIGLIKEKFTEFNDIKDPIFITVKQRQVVQLGCFVIEFVRTTHSIADALGLSIETPVGRIVHTGDFKFDLTPVDGNDMDFYKFAEYGEKGTLLLLSDSTNADREGFTQSEKNVREAFEDIFSKAPGRIIITTFASNLHRIQQAIDVAVKYDKKIITCGRSMVSNAKIAMDLGYLKIPGDMWLKVEHINNIPPEKAVIITTGSQGEPMSVLSRISMDTHKHIKITAGDTVIISARVIPGNERAVGKIIDRMFKKGANVIYEKVSQVHVSGHASAYELQLMLKMVKPKYFIPIHGEYRRLMHHSKLAQNLNFDKNNIFILQNGDILELTSNSASITDTVTAGRVYIDGKSTKDVTSSVLKERKRLAEDGLIIALISINKENGSVISEPEIISCGFVPKDSAEELIASVRELILSTINIEKETIKNKTCLADKIRTALKRFIRNTTAKRPIIMPLVVEV